MGNKKKYIIAAISLFTMLAIGIGTIINLKLQNNKAALVKKTYEESQVKKEQEVKTKEFEGQVLSTFGDSITAQNKWQPIVASELGFIKCNNYGISGTKVSGNSKNSMWQDSRINSISKDSDVILFMGGTNDWLHNVPLGNLGNTDINTFYGSLNVMYKKMNEKFPESKIIFMSTAFAMAPGRIQLKKNGIVNNLGLSITDYGEAIEKFANLKKIPFINLTKLWNKDNIAIFVSNEGAFLHPNKNGGKKMAGAIVARLRELKTNK